MGPSANSSTPPAPGLPTGIKGSNLQMGMCVSGEAEQWPAQVISSAELKREPSMAPSDLWPCPLTVPSNPSARNSEATGLGPSSLLSSYRPREALGKMTVSVLEPLPLRPGHCLSLITCPSLITKSFFKVEPPNKRDFRFCANSDPLVQALSCGLWSKCLLASV